MTSTSTMVHATAFALCLAVAALLLAADVPASDEPVCSELKIAAARSPKLRRFQDFVKSMAGRETSSKKETRLRAEHATRCAEEAALRAEAAARERSRKVASLQDDLNCVLIACLIVLTANAAHSLHAVARKAYNDAYSDEKPEATSSEEIVAALPTMPACPVPEPEATPSGMMLAALPAAASGAIYDELKAGAPTMPPSPPVPSPDDELQAFRQAILARMALTPTKAGSPLMVVRSALAPLDDNTLLLV